MTQDELIAVNFVSAELAVDRIVDLLHRKGVDRTRLMCNVLSILNEGNSHQLVAFTLAVMADRLAKADLAHTG